MTSDPQISERESEILRLVATGASNQQIAQQLNISINTVKVHLRNIFGKIGAASRTEATLYAVRTGLVKVSGTSLGTTIGPSGTATEDNLPIVMLAQPSEELLETETLVVERAEPIVAAERGPALLVPLDEGRHPVSTTEQAQPPARGLNQRWLFGGVLLALLIVVGLTFALTRAAVSPPPVTAVPATADMALPAQADRWRELLPMPVGRAGFALANFTDGSTAYLYAIGGEQGGSVSGAVVRYDLNANVWAPWGNKPTAVSDIQAAVIGSRIYVPGGRLASGEPTTTFEVYNPQNNLWTALKPLPQPRSGYALAAVEGKLYLFGGWDGATYRSEVWQYNPDRDEWSERSPMPTPRAYAGAAAVEGQIYVVGGENTDGALTANELYNPAAEGGQPWATQQPLLAPRSRMAVVESNHRIFVVGGTDTNDQLLVYNNAWQTQAIPLVALRDLRAQVIRDKLYIVGGQGAGGTSPQVYEYQAFYTVMLPVGKP